MPKFDCLFIAEKPSLAEGIAQARAEQLGVKAEKRSSEVCWIVGDDRVTWLFGHMYDTAGPDAYGPQWKQWSIANLPITVPFDKWKLVISEDKRPAPGGRPSSDKSGHIRAINRLLHDAKRVVNCGDAAREGQLLVDELIIEAGIDPFLPNVSRLWVKSLTRKDMLAALNSMKPNAEKKTLYNSAVCRQRADWLHGMNYTRLYTGLARQSGTDAVIPIGRVMTPTLRLVVDRDRERLHFKEVKHYLPKISFKHEKGAFAANWIIPGDAEGLDAEGRLIDRTVADSICAKIDGQTGRITSFKAELKTKGAPLPFSLSALQAECGARLQMTADETLNIAQALYEKHKATTYPRSDSRYLPTAILKDEVPQIMRSLAATEDFGGIASKADLSLKSAAWDDSKVSDHHGIIPTTEISAAKIAQMDETEFKVFQIIARAFIAQFHPSYKWKATTVDVLCAEERFRANGQLITDQGWKIVYGAEAIDDEDDKADDAQSVPPMAQGDSVVASGSSVTAKTTSKPPEFTDGTLITAMVNAHRFEVNPELKKKLKEGDGIGTEATRAATIQKLLRSKMLERKGKDRLVSGEFGRSIIDMLPEEMRSLGMTALWEGLLSQVEKGAMAPELFLDRQMKNIADKVSASRDTKITVKGVTGGIRPIPGHGASCPKCKIGVLMTREVFKGDDKGKKYLSCSRYPDCSYRAAKLVEPMPGDGKTCATCGTGHMFTHEGVSKEGKPYRCLMCSNFPDCKAVEWGARSAGPEVPPIPGHGEVCEVCRVGKMMTKQITAKTGKTYIVLACDNYPACKTTKWPSDAPASNPMPGEGKECTVCHKGVMKTKEWTKDGVTKRRLSCSNYPACKNTIWDDSKPQGKDAPSSGTSAKGSVSARRR